MAEERHDEFAEGVSLEGAPSWKIETLDGKRRWFCCLLTDGQPCTSSYGEKYDLERHRKEKHEVYERLPALKKGRAVKHSELYVFRDRRAYNKARRSNPVLREEENERRRMREWERNSKEITDEALEGRVVSPEERRSMEEALVQAWSSKYKIKHAKMMQQKFCLKKGDEADLAERFGGRIASDERKNMGEALVQAYAARYKIKQVKDRRKGASDVKKPKLERYLSSPSTATPSVDLERGSSAYLRPAVVSEQVQDMDNYEVPKSLQAKMILHEQENISIPSHIQEDIIHSTSIANNHQEISHEITHCNEEDDAMALIQEDLGDIIELLKENKSLLPCAVQLVHNMKDQLKEMANKSAVFL